MHAPTYLRVVVTTRCNYHCGFCHLEGDPSKPGLQAGLERERLVSLVAMATRQGVRKLKFLGGEPLLRKDLPQIIGDIRRLDVPPADISIITAGAVPVERLDAAFDAGLDRANMSVHGFGEARFALHNRSRGAWGVRQRFMETLLERGRPVKFNYVWTGDACADDFVALCAHLRGTRAVVALLDELGTGQGHATVARACRALLGAPRAVDVERDRHSLPTARWVYDGLTIELKDHRLGDLAPSRACAACPRRATCDEGIFALRLTHDGRFQPCMDRPDLALDARALVDRHGLAAAEDAFAQWLGAMFSTAPAVAA